MTSICLTQKFHMLFYQFQKYKLHAIYLTQIYRFFVLRQPNAEQISRKVGLAGDMNDFSNTL